MAAAAAAPVATVSGGAIAFSVGVGAAVGTAVGIGIGISIDYATKKVTGHGIGHHLVQGFGPANPDGWLMRSAEFFGLA